MIRALIRFSVDSLVVLINLLYRDRPYPRFYALETIARVPYFSYLSVLHLYETFGLWRKAGWLKIHFAQSWNELHHLLIMEALGGDRHWIDRFFAQHMALVYYWTVAGLYVFSPRSAYYMNELIEAHAHHTYDTFLKEHEADLKTKNPPAIARKYYHDDGDRYMFDEFQTDSEFCPRRPEIDTLYDVFVNIRDDEGEHVKTMVACQKPDAQKNLKSPNTPDKAGERLDLPPVSNEEFQAAKQEETELVGSQRSQPTKS